MQLQEERRRKKTVVLRLDKRKIYRRVARPERAFVRAWGVSPSNKQGSICLSNALLATFILALVKALELPIYAGITKD